MKAEFEWAIRHPEGDNRIAYVIERLVGYDLMNEFGPMPSAVAQAFVATRRRFVARTVKQRAGAVKLFEPHKVGGPQRKIIINT